MRYRKIHILGGPGSGKSSVAAKIAATFGIAAYDLDDLFWDPAAPTYGVRADKEQRDQALAALVRQESWVIEGAYYKWLTPSFERADLIVLLTPSVWLRDWRLVKRYVLQLGGKSASRKKETFASLLNLLHWNHTYEKNVLVPARALLFRLRKRPIECRTLAQVLAVF
ncbi:MAG: DNA topology modulation protein FlaR [Chloroflexi bacterium]|nr:MAG: DNA topology modulation protein FlaR [Chloroflexota bacterium]